MAIYLLVHKQGSKFFYVKIKYANRKILAIFKFLSFLLMDAHSDRKPVKRLRGDDAVWEADKK